jgi:hypothetical protein
MHDGRAHKIHLGQSSSIIANSVVKDEALKKTKGAGGDALLAAMKSMKWESPRGPISINPETRDIVQNRYIRWVKKVNGGLHKSNSRPSRL